MAYRSKNTVLALLSVLVLAPAGMTFADDHEEIIRKVDIAEVGKSGAVDASIDVASAGQPNAAAIEALAEGGYAAVIDLRGPDENRGYDEQAVVEKSGMSYVALPVTSADDLSLENAAKLDELLASFDGPVLVHCGSGNRVGALLALRAAGKGASSDDALELGRAAGLTRMEDLVRERLEEEDQK